MNLKNAFYIVAGSMLISILFLINAFVSLEVRAQREMLSVINREISELKANVKRKKIVVNTLTTPLAVYRFAEKNGYRRVPIKNIDVLYIDE